MGNQVNQARIWGTLSWFFGVPRPGFLLVPVPISIRLPARLLSVPLSGLYWGPFPASIRTPFRFLFEPLSGFYWGPFPAPIRAPFRLLLLLLAGFCLVPRPARWGTSFWHLVSPSIGTSARPLAEAIRMARSRSRRGRIRLRRKHRAWHPGRDGFVDVRMC